MKLVFFISAIAVAWMLHVQWQHKHRDVTVPVIYIPFDANGNGVFQNAKNY